MKIRFCCSILLLFLTFSLWASNETLSGFFVGKLPSGQYVKLFLQQNQDKFEGYWGIDDAMNVSYVPNAITVKGSLKAQNFLILKQAAHDQDDVIVFEGFYDAEKRLLRGDWLQPKSQPIDLKPLQISLKKDLSLDSLRTKELDEELHKTVIINAPELRSSKELTDHERAFAAYIENRLFKIKNEFTRDVLVSGAKDNTFFYGNSMLHIDHEVTYAKYPYVSIRFNISTYYAGAMHPIHSTLTINYDLEEGKPIVLGTLFKTYSNHLKFIADLAETQLNMTLQDIVGDDPKAVQYWIKHGTKAVVSNYKNWNFTPLGLLISFEPYQVAPYAFGRQEIIIPYGLLNEAFQAKIQQFFK